MQREGKAHRRRHGGNWRRWSDLIQWACLLSWKGNPIIWHFHWPNGGVCLCVCAEKVGLIRLTDSSHFSTALSTHLKTHTHTCMDINVGSRGNFSNSISLFETPIAIAAITVKGIQPPHTPLHTDTHARARLHTPQRKGTTPSTFKKQCDNFNNPTGEVALR